jgi:hypothetical protein
MREQDCRTVMLKDRPNHRSDWTCNAGVIPGKTLEMHAEALLIEMRDPQTLRSLNATPNSREEEVTRCGNAVEFLLRQGTFGQHRTLTCRI